MSTSIEQRVVQMRFDHKQFESGVAQTMSTLDKLESKLKFKDAAKGFDDISKAADRVSLSNLSNQADTLGSKFDALAIIAISALNRITNEAITVGTNLVKSLSIDQVASGWNKYEARTAAVQTLVNATGRSVQEIERYMSKLMLYSDETSYGFADMASALGSMVSAGGELDKLVPLLEGFGNAVSFSGKGATEFTLAIRQLSQAYGAGVMMRQDWDPIQNQLQGAKQLKEVFIEVGEELGKIQKGTVTAGTFSESLALKKWLDRDVMEEAFGRFGEMTERAFEMIDAGEVETVAEAYEVLSETIDDYRIRAAKAAQEAKSFTEAIDATKDAVSTKWMESFQIIFGNYEEATELWTELTNTLWELFAASGDTRNEILSIWKALGGRDEMILAFKAAFEALYKPVEAVKKAIHEIFFPGSEYDKGSWLYSATVAVKEFFQSIILSDEACNTLRLTFKALLLPIHLVVQIARVAWTVLTSLVKVVFMLVDALLSLPSRLDSVEAAFKRLFGDTRYERIATALATIFDKLGAVFTALAEKISSVAKSIATAFSSRTTTIFTKFADALKPIAEWILDRIIDGLEWLAGLDYSKITDWALFAINSLANGFGLITSGCTIAATAIVKFFGSFKEIDVLQILQSIIDKVGELKTGFQNFIKGLGFTQVIQAIKKEMTGVADVVSTLGEGLLALINTLNPAKILLFSFGVSMNWVFINLAKALEAFKDIAVGIKSVTTSFSGLMNAITKRIKQGNQIIQFAIAIGVLAIALGALAQIPGDKLLAATGAISTVIILFGGLMAIMATVNKYLVGSEAMAKQLQQFTISMIGMAGAVALLSASLVILSNVDLDGIILKVALLIGVMGALVAVIKLTSKGGTKSIADAAYIIAFAYALNVMVKALSKLADANLTGCVANLGIMAIIIGLMVGISKMSKNVKLTAGLGLLLMVGGIIAFAWAIQPIANLNFAKIMQALINVLGLMTIVFMIGANMGKGKRALDVGLGMASLAAGIFALYLAVSQLGSLDPNILKKGVAAVGVLMLFVGGMYAIANLGKNNTGVKVQASFISIAAAILIMGVAIDYIGSLESSRIIKGLAAVGLLTLFLSQLARATSTTSKATGAIIAMGVCIGLLVASIALLTLLDTEELIASATSLTIAFISVAAMFNAISKVKPSSAMTSIFPLFAAIASVGLLFSALNDMGDPETLLPKAGAIAVVLAALGASVMVLTHGKNLNKTDWPSVGKTIAIMVSIAAATGALLWVISNWANPENIIEKAIALSAVFTALTAAMRILHVKTGKPENQKNTMDMMARLARIGAITLAAVSWLSNPEDIIQKAGALSAVLLSLSASMRILTTFSKSTDENAIKQTGGLMIVLGVVVTAMLSIFSNVTKDIDGILEKAAGLSLLLITMASAIAIISVVGKALGALGQVGPQAIIGAAVAIGIIAALGAIIVAVGYAFSDNTDIMHWLDTAEMIIPRIARIITEFFGSLISGTFLGVVDTVCAAIERFGSSLSNFAENASGFFSFDFDESKVAMFVNLAAALAVITGAELIDGIRRFFGSKGSLEEFGQQLSSFADPFSEFITKVSDVDADKVNAVAACMESLASVLANIPVEGGIWGLIFGNSGLDTFGAGLSTLAQGVVDYATILSTAGIDQDTINITNSITRTLIELANSAPATDGLATMFEKHDIGVFGEQLATFGGYMASFYEAIKTLEIDQSKVDAVKAAGDTMVALAQTVPSSGALIDFLGRPDIGVFGAELAEFGAGLVGFYAAIAPLEIDQGKVDAVKAAGDTLVELANTVPNSGALVDFLGGKDIGKFGEQIGLFGSGIANFFSEITKANLDSEMVQLAADAGLAFVEISNALEPNVGVTSWWESTSLETFGTQVSKLGEGLNKFWTNTKSVNWPQFAYAVNQIERLVTASILMGDVTSSSATNFKQYLTDLATASYQNFIDTFVSAEETISMAIYNTLSNAVNKASTNLSFDQAEYSSIVEAITNGIVASQAKLDAIVTDLMMFIDATAQTDLDLIMSIGSFIIDGIISGIESKIPELESKILALIDIIITKAQTALDITGNYSQEFYKIGEYTIEGYIMGLEAHANIAYTKLREIGANIVLAFQQAVGVNSPSVKFAEIGKYTIQGFILGVEQATGEAIKAVVKMGEDLLNSMLKFWGIHSPSTVARDEVGRYIVKGVAEGITSDTSAEEAAAKKAQNIISAFQSEFNKWSLDTTTADLEFQLWQALNPNASESEVTAKQVELLDKKLTYQAERVNAAAAQYKATAEILGDSAEETQSAYNTYLQEQITMANLAKELMDARTPSGETDDDTIFAVSADKYNEYISYYESIKDEMESLGHTATEISKMAAEATGYDEYLTNRSVSSGLGNLTSIIDDYMSKATGSIDGMASNVQVVLQDTVPKAASAGYSAGRAYSGGLASAIADTSDSPVSAVEEVFEEMTNIDPSDYAGYIATDFVDTIRNGFDNAGDFITDSVKGAYNKFVDFFGINTKESKMKENGEKVVGDFAHAIKEENVKGTVKKPVEELARSVTNIVKPLPGDYQEIGLNMSIGMANGISSGELKVTAAANRVANAAIKATKDTLAVKSPSRVYYEIGKYMDQGLANGIVDGASSVENAVTTVLGKIEDIINNKKNELGLISAVIEDTSSNMFNDAASNEAFYRMLIWDANGNLIPVENGIRDINYGAGDESVRWWVAPSTELAASIRELSDIEAERAAYEEANRGGYEGTMKELQDLMREMASKDSVNFTQNNYSPAALSTSAIYRNTKSALSYKSAGISPTNQSLKSTKP